MQLKTGMVVYAIAGKEQGKLYCIIRKDEQYIYLADGKQRPIEKPKRKNPKHIRITKTIWNLEGMTNKALRQKLHQIKEGKEFV